MCRCLIVVLICIPCWLMMWSLLFFFSWRGMVKRSHLTHFFKNSLSKRRGQSLEKWREERCGFVLPASSRWSSFFRGQAWASAESTWEGEEKGMLLAGRRTKHITHGTSSTKGSGGARGLLTSPSFPRCQNPSLPTDKHRSMNESTDLGGWSWVSLSVKSEL